MKKTTIVAVKPAGPNHQVLSVKGGASGYRRKPCETCPWRKDAVGEFPAEAFRITAHTAYDASFEMFSCHSSGSVKPAVCAGFILNGSLHNIGMRLAMSANKIDPCQVTDGGAELFDSYRAMAIANGVGPNDPILASCRDY